MLNIIRAHAVNNLCYKAYRKMVPQGIVVHSTGANNPYLKRYVDAPEEVGTNRYGNHWNTAKPGGRNVCVHAFIGYDKDKEIRIAEILPLDICCWGVGKGKNGTYNYDPAYIQFEICEDDLTDETYYQNAFTVAAKYCAHLCKTYGLSTEKIVGHCEAYKQGYGSNHSDPEHWMKRFGQTMTDFRSMVSEVLNESESQEVCGKEPDVDSNEISKGDLVSVAEEATYYNGKAVPAWVKAQNWYVKDQPKGDRVVIDENEKGTSSICSPIHRRFLKVVDPVSTCPYLVKVTANRLNIRQGAGTMTEKVGTITDKGVYTIIEEKNGKGATKWGKLKSGKGWISLDYVRKV